MIKENRTPDIPFPDEIAHLESIHRDLDDALESAEASVTRMDKDYRDMQRYMAEYRAEIDPHEMFQNTLGLQQIDRSGAFAAKTRGKLAQLKDSPYFARIDFRSAAENEEETFYIGPFSFSYEGALRISDWRSPVAGMFYDQEVGPAAYIAPMGEITGELTRKRQFKIKNGILQYALESSLNIQDDILKQELAHTSDEKMKSIISTIQREQNQIIRSRGSGTMIIQGVAGSGKTSIALHRIAFLLYRDKLSARNVAILSPNKVFGDYISNVLPELGEERIDSISLADIAKAQMEKRIGYQEDNLASQDAGWAKRAQFKSTLRFVHMLDEFIEQMPDIAFAPTDYAYGNFTETADSIRARFRAYREYPIMRRLQMMADDIHERFAGDNFMEDDIPKSRMICKALRQMLKIKEPLTLYKEFYRRNGLSEMLVLPSKKTLEWADVYPFLYIQAAWEGLRESGVIRHVVIDEMQDYTPIQYAALNALFRCPKTILGDFGQFLHPHHQHTLEDLRNLYGGAEYVELTKSYRSTYEIIEFAKTVKRAGTIEPIERHGEIPAIIRCRDERDELAHIREKMGAFQHSAYASLGIIVKTNEAAKRLYDALSAKYAVHLIAPDSVRFRNGISIASIPMAKGLEFDAVIIPHANRENYSTEYDRSLLYIACTRAMHNLTLLWEGEISPLLGSAKE